MLSLNREIKGLEFKDQMDKTICRFTILGSNMTNYESKYDQQ